MSLSKHTPEQKQHVFKLLSMNTPVADIVSETGVPRSTVYFWKRETDRPVRQSKVQDIPVENPAELDILNKIQDKLDVQDSAVRQILDALEAVTTRLHELERWKKVATAALQPVLEERLEALHNADPKSQQAIYRAQFNLDNFKEEDNARTE